MGFDITGLGSVFNFGSKLIDKLWPNKAEAEQAKLKLFELTQAGEFKELEAELEKARMQIGVNTAEANSGSNFRGGWRPFIGWICGTGLAYAVLIQPLATGLIQAFVPEMKTFVMPNVQTDALMALLFGMLGLGGYRSYEKVVKK
jgi:hypothetical protein